MRKILRSFRLAAIASTLAVTAGLATAPPAAAAPTPGPAVGTDGHAAVSNPDSVLGTNWQKSSDVLVTGSGDEDGFHIYVARESSAFAWTTVATLTASALDFGRWSGSVCLTGSGRYAVAVFAPAIAANKPALLQAGALAAVVDLTTGKAQQVATGVEFSYFNPSCGPTDRALITRSLGAEGGQTDLLTVDAAAGKVTQTRHINDQVTNPTAGPDGDYAIAAGGLVRIGSAGELTRLAKPQGRPFALRATGSSGVDMVSVDGDRAVAQRLQNGQLTTVATGPRNRLQLFGQGVQNVLVGQPTMVGRGVPQLAQLKSDQKVLAVSQQGHLIVDELLTGQFVAPLVPLPGQTEPVAARHLKLTQRVGPGLTSTVGVAAITEAPQLDVKVGTGSTVTGPSSLLSANETDPRCAIGRSDPAIQAHQPSPNQIEWAVDQAVHYQVNVQRPANHLKSGLPSYNPQQLFGHSNLPGGGTVPAQVMLAILAQETNISEASWHAVPGDTGNPLIANYYGFQNDDTSHIDYGLSDCGYGIGQVTTGMSVADGNSVFTHNQQVAIAIDYAANISAALNILIDKWNQIDGDPEGRTWIGTGDPTWIQEWFLAVWAYNSGFHLSADKNLPDNEGRWGLGWLNNPINPRYDPSRDPFLRYTMADAERPSDWAYPERIMGWVERPIKRGQPISSPAYARPTFGSGAPFDTQLGELVMALPDRTTFCSPSMNNCDPDSADPCPADSSACWWHGQGDAGFTCNHDECASERLTYGAGETEPAVERIYGRSCAEFNGNLDPDKDFTSTTTVVYTLPDPAGQYALGCATQPNGGKFTLRAGVPAGDYPGSVYPQVDLHQLGAGYQGHIWFGHAYQGQGLDHDNDPKTFLVGSWTPDLPLDPGERQRFDILAHLPSHGGEYPAVEYLVQPGANLPYEDVSCEIDQGTGSIATFGSDKWVYIGAYELGRGSQVQMNNHYDGEDGSVDVAWDAMAFVPISDRPGHTCKDPYEDET